MKTVGKMAEQPLSKFKFMYKYRIIFYLIFNKISVNNLTQIVININNNYLNGEKYYFVTFNFLYRKFYTYLKHESFFRNKKYQKKAWYFIRFPKKYKSIKIRIATKLKPRIFYLINV